MAGHSAIPVSSWAFPLAACAVFAMDKLLAPSTSSGAGLLFALVLLAVLFGAVFAAVHHAEIIALRTGEPYGTLILTLAVTIIEVALISSIMLNEGSNPALARDTVFAVVMIVANGLIGLCVLLGGLRYGEQGFRTTGANAYLTVLAALATLTLIIPNYTHTVTGPLYSTSQLIFFGIVTLILYGAFLYIQTVRHRDYFLIASRETDDEPATPPDNRTVTIAGGLLLLSLIGVILLSKTFAHVVETGIDAIGAPEAIAGIIVALLILMPESVSALQAARRDKLQKSINLALGSSLATIGLTIPAVSVVAVVLGKPLVLGLGAKETVLLALTLLVSFLTFGTGRTNILNGLVHLVIFGAYLFLVLVP